MLRFLLARTQYHLRWREEMRFARGQVFGAARRIFTAMGWTLQRDGLLAQSDDVQYLDVHEIRSIIRGTGGTDDLRPVVANRRAAYEQYRATPPPPNRFETRGPASAPWAIRSPVGEPDRMEGTLRGTGAFPGVARGLCAVVLDPRAAPLADGRIIVARSTDPGWVPLFMSAAGLAIERGSLLSHSAIVARELGIPTVVGVPGITQVVHTGQWMELDGASGEVRFEAPTPDQCEPLTVG
jgi:pyruvate,water dikinase